MLILSRSFLLLFLPISLLIFWKLLKTQRSRLWWLLIISLGFYAIAGWKFTFLLISISLITFLLAQKEFFTIGIILNLGVLGLFKYWDFGAQAVKQLALLINLPFLIPFLQLSLPLGISFYVFKHIGYLLDIKNKRYPASINFLTFLTYSSFFPQISAGPLNDYKDTAAQLEKLPNALTSEIAYKGLIHLSVGMAKKILLAETLWQIYSLNIYQPSMGEMGTINAFLGIFVIGLYIYIDFSGYTDIALGLGYLFGVTLPPNFDNPYLAPNPNKFWERWHISLSLWFRLYLFSPLSRALLRRWGSQNRGKAQYAANLITMTLVGFWHGAGINFLVWGFYHGVLLNINAWATRKNFRWVNTIYYQIATQLSIFLGWTFFFFGTDEAIDAIIDLFGFNGLGSLTPYQQLPPDQFTSFAIVIIISTLVAFSGFAEAKQLAEVKKPWIAVSIGILLAILLMMMGEPTNFAYVQF